MRLKKQVNGYMTIEACFLVPFIFLIVVWIIFLSSYLYNQCLIKQLSYTAALRGSVILNGNNGQISDEVGKELNKLLENKFIFVESIERDIDVNMLNVTVELKGKMTIPLFGMEIFKDKEWDIYGKGSAKRIDPVTFIRNLRR